MIGVKWYRFKLFKKQINIGYGMSDMGNGILKKGIYLDYQWRNILTIYIRPWRKWINWDFTMGWIFCSIIHYFF